MLLVCSAGKNSEEKPKDHYKKFHKDASFKESLVAESKSLAFGLKKST